MRRSNIWNVVRFEVARNLKKPTFWVAALLLPLLLVGYIGLISLLSVNAEETIMQGANTFSMNLGVYDQAGYLETTKIANADGSVQELKPYESKEQGINDVKSGVIDIFYFIPADFSTSLSIDTYAQPDVSSIFDNYNVPIQSLLTTSASSHMNAEDFAVLTNNISINPINFSAEDNSEIDPNEIISKMIIPILGAILFFILVVMFGNRLTTAMVEEKENRISEIILTSINPKDLIVGKIISLIALGLIQIFILIIPMLLIYLFGSSQNIIPTDITIALDPYTIISTVLLLVLSYFLFVAMCIVIGTMVPTAKDAASFSGILIILVILPLIFVSNFLSSAPDIIVYIMSYFPPSAPIALMFRSAMGTLPIWELIIGLLDLALFSFLSIKLAVFVFRRSAIEFTAKINLKSLFKGTRKA